MIYTLLKCIALGIVVSTQFLSCTDKNQPINSSNIDGNFEFHSMIINGNLTGFSYKTTPKIGDHGYLYSGIKNNYNCDNNLLDFTAYYAQSAYPEIIANPDTVDSIRLTMFLADTLLSFTPDISLYYLNNNNNDSIFNENDTFYDNFNLSNLNILELGNLNLNPIDTLSNILSIELVINDPPIIEELLSFSEDTSKCFMTSQTSATDHLKIYSSESNVKPQLFVYYTITDSSDSSFSESFSLPIVQDLTLIEIPDFDNLSQDSLYIGGSLFESVLKFDLSPFSEIPAQFVLKEDSYLILNSMSIEASSAINILAYPLTDSLNQIDNFSEWNDDVPVDKTTYMPIFYEDGKLKIRIQSYLQYVINGEIDHFGISLKSSINNDPFSKFSIEDPDSGFSEITIEYVSGI